jgi:hypothetical protein
MGREPARQESVCMPRFVILEHDHPTLHWDLMLEWGDVLRTWRLAEAPTGPGSVNAEPSFDHRLHYLDYEGPVSGNRGSVHRWDHGVYRLEEEQEDRLIVWFEGGRLQGRVLLARVASIPVEHKPGAGGGRSGDCSQDQTPDEAP